MADRSRHRRRLTRSVVLAGGALTGAAGLALAERRHLAAIAADPEFRTLTEPLGGRPLAAIRSADGTRLHAQAFGVPDAPATLVLAHGWTERIDFWGPVIRGLAGPRWRIVAYDLRGHGESAPAARGDYALERFGEDLDAVLRAAGAPAGQTVVVGHSLGAMSIAAWARTVRVPERVAGVGLLNTGLSDLIGGALVLGALGARLAPQWLSRGLLGAPGRLLPVSTPVSLAATRRIAFGPDAGDGLVAFYERMLAATEPRARAAIGIGFSTLELADAVPHITVPTLVLAGEDDRLTPPAHAHAIAAALPAGSDLRVLERTGHMAPLERPRAVVAALRDLCDAAGVSPVAEAVA